MFLITLQALKYWLDMPVGSFLDLTCTGTCQQDAAHQLPMNFSAVESFSRLMVSTGSWFLHFSTEQTEAVCPGLPVSFLLRFGEGDGPEGKAPCWGHWSLILKPTSPLLDFTKWNTECYWFASLCSFFLRLYFCGSIIKKTSLGFDIWICCACNKDMWDQFVVLFTYYSSWMDLYFL